LRPEKPGQQEQRKEGEGAHGGTSAGG
jgi:hypothetical protein